LCAVASGKDDAVAVLAVFGGGQFCADAEQGCQSGSGEDAFPVPIYVVLKTGVASGVGADKVV